jgi:hypothetical protein
LELTETKNLPGGIATDHGFGLKQELVVHLRGTALPKGS